MGALIAAERNDRSFWSFWSETVARGIVPVIPAGALAQAWRGPWQARLAQVMNACFVEPLDEALAKSAGELCGKVKSPTSPMPPWSRAPPAAAMPS